MSSDSGGNENNGNKGKGNGNGKSKCQFPNIVNDGVCDAKTNNLQCDFDGGDCCDSSTQGEAYLLFCESCECLNSTNPGVNISGLFSVPKLSRNLSKHTLSTVNL